MNKQGVQTKGIVFESDEVVMAMDNLVNITVKDACL